MFCVGVPGALPESIFLARAHVDVRPRGRTIHTERRRAGVLGMGNAVWKCQRLVRTTRP